MNLTIIIILLTFVTIISLALGLYFDRYYTVDQFNNIIYPKLGDAFDNSHYSTFGQECKPGLFKCKVNGTVQGTHYFCSSHPNCEIKEHNIKGHKMKEPLTWFERFI